MSNVIQIKFKSKKTVDTSSLSVPNANIAGSITAPSILMTWNDVITLKVWKTVIEQSKIYNLNKITIKKAA